MGNAGDETKTPKEIPMNLPADVPGAERSALFEMHECVVIGSGAAGLNAAVQLRRNGVKDVVIVTEGLNAGTSINTGSDKQTYYKLSLCGEDADSPVQMASTFYDGGGMHGDLALVEASVSARGFMNLVELGVPFPRDEYGQFAGYKTDHDPRRRATSIGPYTSREMCRALIREVDRLEIPVLEDRVAVELLTTESYEAGVASEERRVCGVVVVNGEGRFEVYGARSIVFAVGGPGGLYETSVYPEVHTGSIGLALRAGAVAVNLSESQFGLASTGFRWNVSGSFMQVIPRFISLPRDAEVPLTDESLVAGVEFLTEYFESLGEMHSMVFLKGYQWPFDSRKVMGGSSLIDVLVYIETVVKGRRVFLDFRSDPRGFDPEALSSEANEYLRNSGCLEDGHSETPLKRLFAMNPGAVELYADHGIDLRSEPLEVAVCAQHNNGGLGAGIWWESRNLRGLFPVGEVNGSHGVYRPGGSALNSGQVGGIRAAEYIGMVVRSAGESIDEGQMNPETIPIRPETVYQAAESVLEEIGGWLRNGQDSEKEWSAERQELRQRMSRNGAHIRENAALLKAADEAWRQYRRLDEEGCRFDGTVGCLREALRTRQLCMAHAAYLDAIRFAVESGVGSRGSAMVLSDSGEKIHPKLEERWRIERENEKYREKILETMPVGTAGFEHRWVPRRSVPAPDLWFESVWARFRKGQIYR